MEGSGEALHTPRCYGFALAGSEEARHCWENLGLGAFETATKHFSDAEKSLFAEYHAHTNQTVEREYRMREPIKAFTSRKLLDRICGSSE